LKPAWLLSLRYADSDGLASIEEANSYGTDPLHRCTDKDEARDGWEIENDSDPLTSIMTLKVARFLERIPYGDGHWHECTVTMNAKGDALQENR
jgi:hypothetical protein